MTIRTTARMDRRRLTIVLGAGVSALALLLVLLTGQTIAGFTDTTENPGNLFRTGNVELTDDRGGVAVFTVTGLLPGSTVTDEITVTNLSGAALKVKLFSAGFGIDPEGSGLADNLNVNVALLDAPGGSETAIVFAGTLAELAALNGWDTGASAAEGGDEVAASGEPGSAQAYRFTVELDPGAGRESENVGPEDEATITFVWEGRA